MRKLFQPDLILVTKLFLSWIVVILIASSLAFFFVPLAGKNFLGGGFERYSSNSFLYSRANFDGEHYLSIAQNGYQNLEHSFFPVYPMLMNFFAYPFGAEVFSLTISGIFISNIALLLSLLILWKLTRLDYSYEIGLSTLILFLVFPTSFYLGVVYSESVFLLFTLTSFYFARKKKWFLASIFAAIASATRMFGLLIFPALILEAWQQKQSIKKVFSIILAPLGFFIYMYYQWYTVADPLAFYHQISSFGPQRQEGVTLLPQVYFRYIKILLTTNIVNPIYQVNVFEFLVGILYFFLPIYGYVKKVRLSYLFYSLTGFLLPTITGSFSSLPRYVLVLFPSFIVLALIVNKLPKLVRLLVYLVSVILLCFEAILFLRGYWIA